MLHGILTGILAGYIASRLQKGQGSGCLTNLFLGVVGGIVGSWIFHLLGIHVSSGIGEIVMAVVGAVAVLWVFAKLN